MKITIVFSMLFNMSLSVLEMNLMHDIDQKIRKHTGEMNYFTHIKLKTRIFQVVLDDIQIKPDTVKRSI